MSDDADLLDMEDDVLASAEMTDAVFRLLEAGARHGFSKPDVYALLRCASYAQDHAREVVRRWKALVQTGPAA